MSSNPLKVRLVERLRCVEPVALQRLAQDVAAICFPGRFTSLQVQGENDESQPVKGWPDAYAISDDSTIDGVEATREKNGNWRKHLNDDLAKAAKLPAPGLGGYFFVGGYPSTRAKPGDISRYHGAFCDLGIPPDKIHFLIGEGLVHELLKPQYSRVLQVHLGIAPSPNGFETIGGSPAPIRARFGFEPTVDEFREGLIFRPKEAEIIEKQLREAGYSLLLGRGAAGKSVLARLIASQGDYRLTPSYYLSLRGKQGETDDLRGRVENALTEFGGPGVLFIIDDVHLDTAFCAALWAYWNEVGRAAGTRLLLVGREIRTKGRTAWSEIDVRPTILYAGIDSVRGVYVRIVSRSSKKSGLALPPDGEMKKWIRTFGGPPHKPDVSVDLMALGAAIQRKRNQLGPGNWMLTADDARQEVREAYLSPLSEGERGNLLRLSSLPEDFALPFENLADGYAGFKECLASGLVFETEGRKGGSPTYSLVHSALGRLLLAEHGLTGAAQRNYVYLNGHPFAVVDGAGTVSYVLNDHLGQPQKMLNAAGAVTWHRSAGVYGDTASQPVGATAANPLRFPGQQQDSVTGLHYNYFRDYDPATGRYLEADPIGLAGGANLYAYVEGNPVNAVDPYGLETVFEHYTGLPDYYRTNAMNAIAGVSDAATLGATNKVRDWLGLNKEIDPCSPAYRNGEIASLALGGGRLLYAGGAKAGARLAGSAESAVNFRNGIKRVMRGPLAGSGYRIKTYGEIKASGKYADDAAIKAAAGRTNPRINAIGASAAAGGGAGLASDDCGCQ